MKRFFAMILALLCLASCGAPAGTTTDEITPDQTVTDTQQQVTTAPEEIVTPEEIDEPAAITAVRPSEDSKYTIAFANGNTQTFDVSNASAVFEKAKSLGYEGSLIGLLASTALNLEGRFAKETGLGAKGFGKALAAIFENFDKYFEIGGDKVDGQIKIAETEGYMGENGTAAPNSATQTYRYTQKVPVVEGQTFELVSDGNNLGMRFVTAFNNSDAIISKSMVDTSCTVTKFVVPAGVTHVVATYRYTGKDVYAVVTGGRSEIKISLKNKVDADTLVELATGVPVEFNADLSATSAQLKDAYLYLEDNDVMHNKALRLTFNVNELKDGQTITIGHGETSYGGSAVELTKDTIKVYKFITGRVDVYTQLHGINISGKIELEVKTGFGNATVSVENAEDKFTSDTVEWYGRQGKIFAKSSGGADLSAVKIEWRCDDYDKAIWIMGDSYVNTVPADRWPHYLLNAGYTDYFMSGFPGRESKRALADFKQALEHGTPKYAVWCLGMNNPDSETEINSVYKSATEEFIAICKEKGITPILATIPNTPTNINIHKNAWVKASGYRYIDFAAAVGGEAIYSPWTSGMLAGDKVHPATAGASALYKQFINDFPEIKG